MPAISDDVQARDTESSKRWPITVFFPCYNEEKNVRQTVEAALSVLPALSNDFEIIIVNDGSRDRTAAVAEEVSRQDSRIRVVHHDVNRGYGVALRSGFRAATKELVFYTDGDGQYDVSELARLLPLIDQYDIVSGFRRNRRDGLLRRINAFCWGRLVTALLHFRCRDVDSAFKLYRRRIFDHIELKSTGALIDAEILARATRAGYTLIEVPISHKPRMAGRQTGGRLSVILKAFKELVRLRRDILRTRPREPS